MTQNTIAKHPADLGPKLIFDSRVAKELYDNYKEYRSATFNVPPGFIGLVELIAPENYLPDMTFTAVRIPAPMVGQDSECRNNCDIGKRYRRWKCRQSLGNNTTANNQSSGFTSYKSTIVHWGHDPFTKDIVEFEYIVRPGSYFLEANRCINKVLDDCINPTIIELSLLPSVVAHPDLVLPCNPKYGPYWTGNGNTGTGITDATTGEATSGVF